METLKSERFVDAKTLYLHMKSVIEDPIGFMKELWSMLDDAQKNEHGIPVCGLNVTILNIDCSFGKENG